MAVEKVKQLSYEELSMLCEQLAVLISAGVPLNECIEAMSEDAQGDIKKALSAVLDEVREHSAFSAALESAGAFPVYMTDMTRIGEKSGRLDNVMHSLAEYYDRLDNFYTRLKGALLYPVILVGMMTAVLAVLINNVLPVFAEVYEQLGSGMSPASQNIMRFGTTAGQVMIVVCLVLFVLLLMVFLLSRSKKGGKKLTAFFASFGPTKKLSVKISVGRFVSAMSVLLSSGIVPERAIELALPVVENKYAAQKIERSRRLADGGTSWGRALDECGIFSGMDNNLVRVGLKTGRIDGAMQRIADNYDEEIAGALTGAIAAAEPILIGVLSGIIGIVLVSVMLPLISIISSIG